MCLCGISCLEPGSIENNLSTSSEVEVWTAYILPPQTPLGGNTLGLLLLLLDIVSCPSNVHPIGCKWVYSIKLHSDGTLDRYKARLVVLGNKKEYSVNYEETFAPVAKITTVRTIIAIAASQNWTLHQMDVKNAFLHGDLKEDIYMKPPPGLFSLPTSDVCKLKRSLYRLKQAPRAWFAKFRFTFLQFSFEQSNYDSSLFVRKTSTGCVLLLVYVDDIIIPGNDSSLITSLQQQLKDSFHMKDLRTLTYFLGLEVHRDSSGVFLNQHKYTQDLISLAGLQNSSSVDTPLELNFMQAPRHLHLVAVRRIIRYLRGTSNRGLFFPSGSPIRLNAFSDSDWAGCSDTRHSVTGLLSLEYLLLKDNNFEIPISFESFANHSKLKYVIPDDNSFVQSSVKSWIPKFQLEALSLTNNCSEMPNFLHYQRNLRQLSLSKCNMGGNFPNWLLENNTRLEEIYLDGNAFTGTLQLSFLPNLKTFDISNNKIQGQLPPNIGSIFPNMLRLQMSKNMIEGTLPSSFGDMKNLQCLDLSYNKLSGDLPIELARNGSKLFFLRLSNNMLEGEIFPVSTDINSFKYLYLDGNNFSGPIPQKLSAAPLSSLDLSNNNLSGNVPSWIGYISSLTSLALSNNNLNGPIPVDYCRLEGLEVLDLSRNNIVGVVPSCFRASQNLRRVYLSENNLEGQFDMFSTSLDLRVLDLGDTNFSGSIPKWLGSSLEITTLLLKGNHLQGTIPTELCHASKLRIMDLSHNNLSGPIPHCVGNIMQLTGAREAYPYGPRFYFPGFQTWGRDAVVYVEDSMTRLTIHFQVNYAWVGADFTTKHNTYSYEGRVVDSMAGIDLSNNQLSGEIPRENCSLTAMRA
ncbi:hypothetical protein BC332_29488 [Capsicum chinense]|nr:hypothetical protein BC332_29488 [Capsicum chinense]